MLRKDLHTLFDSSFKHNTYSSHHLKYVRSVLSWLTLTQKGFESAQLGKLSYLLGRLDRIYQFRGIKQMTLYMKDVRTSLLRTLAGSSPEGKVRLTYDGYPVVLGPLIPIIRREVSDGDYCHIQILTTVLWSSRALKGKPVLDIGSITDPISVKLTLPKKSSVREF